MDIRQLHYFCTIVQEGQITRAAKKLHMAQPPLSQQLKQLEQELGVTLLERNGRSLELTEAGKLLYKRAQHLLTQLEETKQEVKETGEGLRGVLAIGSVKTCFSHLPDKIRQFRELYPDVSFQLREGDTFFVSELLRNREVELAIVRLPLNTQEFSMISLPKERYVAVVPQQWEKRLSSKDSISMKELQHFPLLLLHRINGVGQFEMVINECKRHGFYPKIVCDCPDAAMLLALVDAGVGVTLVPKSTLNTLPTKNTLTVEINDSALLSESAVIWLKDRYLSKSARFLLQTFDPEIGIIIS
ncbi:DNA-binding transcriptional LysR family regulator [Bacillus oleivorans]|uniref:DNA-binding transcriptional LysR family regulator n=1 Tax=Bacillus oleivorans TaxID=1448271 RepID=A0A285CMF5_9BACI|nr:LysR family transcriptional regulator [Bacillus oleivorans]SNX68701.1 DNA-binding transcriptional LysR family regulator [Bacillus oleivorans]